MIAGHGLGDTVDTAFDFSSLDLFSNPFDSFSPIITTPPFVDPGSSVSDLNTIVGNLNPIALPTSTGNIGSGTDWSNILVNDLQTGINKIAVPILNSQFGGPKPGQFTSYNAKTGQYTNYALPSGSSQVGFTSFPGSSFSGSSLTPLLLIGGAVLVAVMMFKR